VFGVRGDAAEERTFFDLFDGAPAADVVAGEVALYPERPLRRFPSLLDAPERAWLAERPGVSLRIAPGAGHNVHVFAADFLRALLLAALDKALAPVEP